MTEEQNVMPWSYKRSPGQLEECIHGILTKETDKQKHTKKHLNQTQCPWCNNGEGTRNNLPSKRKQNNRNMQKQETENNTQYPKDRLIRGLPFKLCSRFLANRAFASFVSEEIREGIGKKNSR